MTSRAKLAFLLALVVASCTPSPSRPVNPVILIGIDGLEWSVVLEEIERGRLPTLGRLIKSGVSGRLSTLRPTLSPAIWTSIVTGVRPGVHGIRGFVERAAAKPGRRGRLYNSRDRRSKALWDIAGEAGYRCAVVGWWMTYPVDPINGVMVAQVNTSAEVRRAGFGIKKGRLFAGLTGQVYPPEREQALLAHALDTDRSLSDLATRLFGFDPADTQGQVQALLRQSLWSVRADHTYERIALDLLDDPGAYDLFALYLGGTDVLAHRFWRYAYPDQFPQAPSEQDAKRYGGMIAAYYQYVDGVVERVLSAATENANVIIVSDHGMEAQKSRAHHTSAAHANAPDGVVIVAGPDIRASNETISDSATKELGSVLDITPTVLALLDLPVGRDMPGRVLAELLAPALSDQRPIGFVDSHTADDWARARGRVNVDEERGVERLEQLRALGYIE